MEALVIAVLLLLCIMAIYYIGMTLVLWCVEFRQEYTLVELLKRQ